MSTKAALPAMTAVKSSAMKEVGYDHDSKELLIRFSSGQVYGYSVDHDVFNQLVGAESHGKFFRSKLMKLPHRKVK